MKVIESVSGGVAPSISIRPPVVEPGLSSRLRQRIATQFKERWEKDWGRKFVTHGSNPGPDAVRLDGNYNLFYQPRDQAPD